MDRDVLITVSGLLFAGNGSGEKENVDVISPGQYYRKNGKHYLLYDEMTEDYQEPVRNIMKISPEQVSLRKNGIISAEMDFSLARDTKTHYSTPFGVLTLGIHTNRIQMEESEDEMLLNIEYGLEINYEHTSDCFIKVLVQPQGEDSRFSLKN